MNKSNDFRGHIAKAIKTLQILETERQSFSFIDRKPFIGGSWCEPVN